MPHLPTLERLAHAIGVPLDQHAMERFDRYRDLLLQWNRRVNLTSVTDPEEVEVKLFADSLALFPYVQRYRAAQPQAGALRLIDIGSGAGFPGLPLKIVDPELDVTLLEATGKKVRFLEAAIEELGLTGVRAVHGRAEELAHDPAYRGRFDIVTARAVARLPTLLEYCLPYCRAGGIGLFPKGREARAEVDDARRALELLRARLVSVESPQVEELSGTHIVVVEQREAAPSKYPRRAGLPAKRPL